jgi:predicted peptidase
MNGSREEADVIVGEQFITITPYVHVYEADANGEYNLTVDGLMAVINDARTKYPIDPARIYIQGYSAVCFSFICPEGKRS